MSGGAPVPTAEAVGYILRPLRGLEGSMPDLRPHALLDPRPVDWNVVDPKASKLQRCAMLLPDIALNCVAPRFGVHPQHGRFLVAFPQLGFPDFGSNVRISKIEIIGKKRTNKNNREMNRPIEPT